MSPYQIKILLHYYTFATDYESRGEMIFEDTMSEFIADNLLRVILGQVRYAITERGTFYCDALTDLPLPVQKWVMP